MFERGSDNKNFTFWVRLAIVSAIVLLCVFIHSADEKIYNVDDLNLQKSKQLDKARRALDNDSVKDALIWLNMIVYDADKVKPDNFEDLSSVVDAYLLLGDIYTGQRSHEFSDQGKAFTFYKKADKYASKYNFTSQKAKALLGIAGRYEIFLSVDHNDVLTDTFINIISRGLDSAIKAKDAPIASQIMNIMSETVFPLKKSDMVSKELNDYRSFANTYGKDYPELMYSLNICRTMEVLSDGRPEEALLISNKMLESEPEDKKYNLIKILSLRAEILMQLGRNMESHQTFNRVASIAETLDDKWILMQVNKILSIIYNNEGEKDQAQDAYAAYLQIKDEIINGQGVSNIKDLHFLGELDEMNLQLQTILIENKYTKIGIILISAVALVFAIMIFFLVRTQRRLKERNRRIYEQYQQILNKEGGLKIMRNLDISPEDAESEEKEISEPESDPMENAEESEEKEKLTRLSDEEMNSIYDKINRVLNESDVALGPKFKLKDLARETGESIRAVSLTINDKCGCNFATFLAQYRINMACKMISESPAFRKLTIEAMAESVGIQSRSYFSTTFKKIVGLNPSEYIRQASLKQ